MRPRSRRLAAWPLVAAASFTPITSASADNTETDQPGSRGAASGRLNKALGEDPPRPRLGKGSAGDPVKRLQKILNEDRRARGAAEIDVDGDFGPETLKALRFFQRELGLEQSGVTDTETWIELEGVESGTTKLPPKTPASLVITHPQIQLSPDNGEPGRIQIMPENNSANDANNGYVQALGGDAPKEGSAKVSEGAGSASATGSSRTTTPKSAPVTPAAGTAHAPMHLSASALDELARIVEAEAGVCSEQGKIAVAAVVLNRVRTSWANGTVHGVISEEGQFNAYGDSVFRAKPSAESVAAAKAAAAGQDPSNGAFYYYNPYLVHPSWAKGMKQTAEIGTNATNTHRFMRP